MMGFLGAQAGVDGPRLGGDRGPQRKVSVVRNTQQKVAIPVTTANTIEHQRCVALC